MTTKFWARLCATHSLNLKQELYVYLSNLYNATKDHPLPYASEVQEGGCRNSMAALRSVYT